MKNKHRISIIMTGILACVGVSLFVFWQTQGPRIISAVNDAILVKASQDLNGRLAAERLEYSLFGETTAHKLVVYDNKSNVVASVDKMIIDFGVADLLRGTLATEKIKRVTVEGARIVLNYDSQGNWNVKNLLKPTSDEELQRFRGELKVNNALNAHTMDRLQTHFI